jgi:hypothetical protein
MYFGSGFFISFFFFFLLGYLLNPNYVVPNYECGIWKCSCALPDFPYWHDERGKSYQTTHWVQPPYGPKNESKLSNIWQECCTFGQCQSWPIVNITICHFLAFSLHEPQSPLALSACLSETIIQSYSVSVDSFLRYTLLYTHIYFITQARLVSPCSHLSSVRFPPSSLLWASSVGITNRSKWLEKNWIT